MNLVRVFRTESLLDVIAHLRDGARELDVLDPDLGRGHYAGELVDHAGVPYVHRPWRVWVDLAERLGLRMLTPHLVAPPLVRLRFEPLDRNARPHTATADGTPGATEKYGATSGHARIAKHEDPGFVLDLGEALARVTEAGLPATPRILDLGVNTGGELELLPALAPALAHAELVGIDHSASAIAVAQARLPHARFHVADVHDLAPLALGRFDLVVSIGTLHSPQIDDREVLRRIVQDHLVPGGAVILGFPNCRYFDGELEHGTRMKNFTQPELGLLVKDVAFYRKYLQQHDREVFVTGKNYLLVTGVRRPTLGR